MKLSEAILAGTKYRPQTHGSLFKCHIRDEHSYEYSSCALGAAYEGFCRQDDKDFNPAHMIGVGISDGIIHELRERFSILDVEIEVDRPGYIASVKRKVIDQIIFMNDQFNMSRENIAAWVANKEKELNY